jgi:hypothetical protein
MGTVFANHSGAHSTVVGEGTTMAESQLTLTDDERAFLIGLLEVAERDSLIEEHRTRSPSYREQILQREDVIASLLKKLGRSSR